MPHRHLLTNFKKPSLRGVDYKVLSEDRNYGKLVAAPFERGYATTIANSLRRVLISSLPGYAITGVNVKFHDEKGILTGLFSAFDNIYGVYEDTLDIIQNLKKVRLALIDGIEERKMTLDFKGKTEITAKDLMIDESIFVYNEDQHIMSLNKEANLSIELTINFGRGYQPAEMIQKDSTEKGFIALDALFSPVSRVNYEVDNYRIDQRADYEQFTLEVWTDGSISVVDAVADAAKILKDHYLPFITFNEEEYDSREGASKDDADSPEEDKLLKAMKTQIEELELNARAYNCLMSISVTHVGDLLLKAKADLERTKNLGQKSLDEIKQKLHKFELYLDMPLPTAVTDKYRTFKANYQAVEPAFYADIEDDEDEEDEE